MIELGRTVYTLIAIAAVMALIEAADDESSHTGAGIVSGLCAMGCILRIMESLLSAAR